MKSAQLGAFCVSLVLIAGHASAQSTLGTFDGEAVSDSQSAAESNTTTVVGGNTFDFSSGAGGLQVPPPPLANIAAGVCAGGGITGSMSVTGLAVGMGRQNVDESCNRRAWVQALLGAAQQLGPNDAAALRAAAIEVMKGDPIVRTAFDSVGITSAEDGAKAAGPRRADEPVMSSKSEPESSCVVYTSRNAPEAYVQKAKQNGCAVRVAAAVEEP